MNFSAPGKIIISGEHAVVFGYPAIASAINLRLFMDRKGKIRSDIPIGRGMGSSAALSVVRSATKIKKLDLEKINMTAYRIEKKYHKNPSGVDNTISTYGGLLWYRKEAEGLKIFNKIIPKFTPPRIFLLDSGQAGESTGEMVDYVSKIYRKKRNYVNQIFHDMELTTRGFLNYFLGDSSYSFDSLIKRNERQLEKLGVVSNSSLKIIRRLEKNGAAVKVTGAGGRRAGSGMLIVYHNNVKKLLKFAKVNNLDLFGVKLGTKGVGLWKS